NLKSRIAKIVDNSTGSEYEGVSVNLELERDFESKDFGGIKSIEVSVSKRKKEIIEVDKIRIGAKVGTAENKNVINKDKAEYNLNDSRIKNEIKNEISKTLGISESIVSVEVQQ
ncbi:MAG: stage III sporulation protein AF, partial [Clostridiaceae bacterium]|nr:stage III sporulation protein AF [Clostridiaceae bacterium]